MQVSSERRHPLVWVVVLALGVLGYFLLRGVAWASKRVLRRADEIELAFRRLGSIILLSVLFLILAIPLSILFPLGIFLVVRWSVSFVVVVIEGKGPLASLGRSWQLTRGLWWHTFGALFLFTILSYAVGVAMAFVERGSATVAAAAIEGGSGVLVGQVLVFGEAIASLLLLPFAPAILVCLYFELKSHHDSVEAGSASPTTLGKISVA